MRGIDDGARPGTRPVRVGIVDDDPMIGQAMRLILTDYSDARIQVAFIATDGEDCVAQSAVARPDVVLVDLAMPAGIDGIEVTRRLRMAGDGRGSRPHVLVLTSLSPSDTVARAVEAGAEGFVSKTDAPEDIIRRVLGVCAGVPQFNDASQRQLIGDLAATRPRSRRDEARAMLDALPEREREAVLLAADGCSNAQIAARMFISERTAKAHLSNAGDRLGMNRVQMARLVERADL